MLPILWWILATALGSFSLPPYKKALGLWKNIPNSFFKLFAPVCGLTVFIILMYFLWFQIELLNDTRILLLIWWLAILWVSSELMWLYIYKRTKLSELLPYGNIDKLFIIIFGFFLYYGISWKETSVTTLIITLVTLCIIAGFTIDFKNIKVPKTITLFIFNKVLSASKALFIGYILLKYSTITYWFSIVIIEIILLICIGLYQKWQLISMIQQSRSFYKNRFAAISMWQTHFILWLFIIESTGVVIASLLWFMSVVFNVIAMKITLNDTPSKKQILLAFIVILMVGLGYYFK